MCLLESVLVHHFTDKVGFAQVVPSSIIFVNYISVRIERRICIVFVEVVQPIVNVLSIIRMGVASSILVGLYGFNRGGFLRKVPRGRERKVVGIVHCEFTLGAFLGSDEDYTECRPCSVDGCGRCIFQDCHALDVLGVEKAHVGRHVVHQNKRSAVSVDRSCGTAH